MKAMVVLFIKNYDVWGREYVKSPNNDLKYEHVHSHINKAHFSHRSGNHNADLASPRMPLRHLNSSQKSAHRLTITCSVYWGCFLPFNWWNVTENHQRLLSQFCFSINCSWDIQPLSNLVGHKEAGDIASCMPGHITIHQAAASVHKEATDIASYNHPINCLYQSLIHHGPS